MHHSEDIFKFCHYFYHSIFIPIYLYEGDCLLYCAPEQSAVTHPPKKYLNMMLQSDKLITYTETDFFAFFGCVHIADTSQYLVIGPVTGIPYPKDSWHILLSEYGTSYAKQDNFVTFFQNIALQTKDTFLNTLLFINHNINPVSMTINDLNETHVDDCTQSVKEYYAEQLYQKNDFLYNENNYALENELVHHISSGNLKELERFSIYARNTKIGTVANDNLRQVKNTFIISLTIAARAARSGGLSPAITYQLSDAYCQQIERLYDCDAVRRLTWEMQKDYTARVAESKALASSNDVLYDVINYIRSNTHRKITTEDAANYVGFSRSHLSKLFSSQLGFQLKDFIMRCKLEESKELLTYSSYSISEISHLLCFSNQSHFQRAFKSTYGITPFAYRRSTSQNHT